MPTSAVDSALILAVTLLGLAFFSSAINDDIGMDAVAAVMLNSGQNLFGDFVTPNGIVPLYLLGGIQGLTGRIDITLVLGALILFEVLAFIYYKILRAYETPHRQSLIVALTLAFFTLAPFGGFYHDYFALALILAILALLTSDSRRLWVVLGILTVVLLFSKKAAIYWLIFLVPICLARTRGQWGLLGAALGGALGALALAALWLLTIDQERFLQYQWFQPQAYADIVKPSIFEFFEILLDFEKRPWLDSFVYILVISCCVIGIGLFTWQHFVGAEALFRRARPVFYSYLAGILFIPSYLIIWGRSSFFKYAFFAFMLFLSWRILAKFTAGRLPESRMGQNAARGVRAFSWVVVVGLIGVALGSALKTNRVHLSRTGCYAGTDLGLYRVTPFEITEYTMFNWVRHAHSCEIAKFIREKGYDKIGFVDDNAYLAALASGAKIHNFVHFYQYVLSVPASSPAWDRFLTESLATWKKEADAVIVGFPEESIAGRNGYDSAKAKELHPKYMLPPRVFRVNGNEGAYKKAKTLRRRLEPHFTPVHSAGPLTVWVRDPAEPES